MRSRILLTFLLVTVLCGFAWFMRPPSEPVYEGKPLSAWLEANYTGKSDLSYEREAWRQEREAPIVHIGTNAVPILLSMLQVKDSGVMTKLIGFLRRQTLIRAHPHTDFEFHSMAVSGFEALGPMGKPAVPGLMAMLDDPELRWAAEISLGWIGSDAGDAAPRLISLLTNADWASRYCAAEALGRIGTATCNAQPALLAQLHDTNRFVQESIELALARQKAYPNIVVPRLIQELQSEVVAGRFVPSRIRALGAFGIKAKPAVPILLQILSNRVDDTHEIANALKQIDPNAALGIGARF